MSINHTPPLELILAAPRGFCAGVDRAIQIVEKALEKYGSPVYVRHEIVHNKYVVEELESKGAIFVEELDNVPDDKPVIFSAHGVPKSVPRTAQIRNMIYVDATCPLVSKVHIDAARHEKTGKEIILIGHKGHPEVIGTMGQIEQGIIHLIETVDDAKNFTPHNPENLAFITQTTLSVDDTKDIITILKQRFPNIIAPNKEDICYATTNRQMAVKELAQQVDCVLVIGATNSSNSVRLVEVAKKAGCENAYLIGRAENIHWSLFQNAKKVGITAGASAPEILVNEVIAAFKNHFDVTVSQLKLADENITFKLPKILINV
jgi:4-hydroxy-3-methylbut-2-enyl diphosphate reductase